MHLVLLPGMDGTGALFRPLVRAVRDSATTSVVAYPADASLTYADLHAHVMDHLPRDREFVLVAESFSGPIALSVAAVRPAGLRAVVLCASFVSSPSRLLPRWLAPAIRARMFKAAPFWITSAMLLGRGAPPDLRLLLHRSLRLAGPEVLAARTRQILRLDARAPLSACPVPVLYLKGEDDRIVGPSNAKTITELNPTVTVRSVASPHLVLQVAPDEAFEQIWRFVSEL